jgi:hypothetical protein
MITHCIQQGAHTSYIADLRSGSLRHISPFYELLGGRLTASLLVLTLQYDSFLKLSI